MTTIKHQKAPVTLDTTREELHRDMLSSVSHDLKTPLATIIGSLEIYQRVQDKLTPEKRTGLINSALSEAYRPDNFITNILDMAKLESGAVVPHAEWCDIDYLLGNCIVRLGPKGAQSNISIHPVEIPEKSFTDPTLLARAVTLVLDNAIKYGEDSSILIEYGDDDAGSFIHIRDHGAGIPAGKEKIIFSKYTRFSRTDYQNAGTGLGLPIARKLMQLLGGDVNGANHADGGAIFTLRYPHGLEEASPV